MSEPCPNAPGCPDPDWCERCNSCSIARSIARANPIVPRRTVPYVRLMATPPEPRHELQYAVGEHGKVTAEYIEVEQTLLGELVEW